MQYPLRALLWWPPPIAAGLIQTWFYRHLIFSDGISYLNLAQAYARGDWRNALNDYWSPLYPWVLEAAIRLAHPAPYWQAATLHVVNFLAFIFSLATFELMLHELLLFRKRLNAARGRIGVSEPMLRLAGYSLVAVAGLYWIGIGQCSPDMLALAIVFLLAALLLRVANGRAGTLTSLGYGAVLGFGYLARSAFAPLAPLYFATLGILAWRKKNLLRAVSLAFAAFVLVAGPFIAAISIAKGRLTFGAAGKLNYGWEVAGAARSIHWQGEPFDIGTPAHPTHRVLNRPATYTFATPVAGSYPPWYDPSYWYDGIVPHLKPRPQIRVLGENVRLFALLLLLGPVILPAAVLMLWEKPSPTGILDDWFLWLPALAQIGMYCMVYLESRYIAGPLLLLWLCALANATASSKRIRRGFGAAVSILCVLFFLVRVGFPLRKPAVLAFRDLVHHREREWNLNWMLAQRFRELGLAPGDRVAFIGRSIDADWVRLAQARIVAEIPVIWHRASDLHRTLQTDFREPDAFWAAPPEIQAVVLKAFRQAGASVVIATSPPASAAMAGWRRVLDTQPDHLPVSSGQFGADAASVYLRIDGISLSDARPD